MVINVKTSMSSYDIVIENNAINNINKYLNLSNKVLIVTDDGIPEIYIKTVKNQIKNCYVYTIKQGEASKSFENYQAILTYMVDNDFTRSDTVIALGGGVVGDLSGFVSSTYMRGIKFVNIPTTLLSQVDSSIGGKTAIDLNNVKNIVGSFYQPSLVIIDPNTLKTLDERQLHSGLVEAIKMSITNNKDLFKLIKNSTDLNKDLSEIIYQAILIKKEIVEKDEKESNLRRVLNFGHTIGHAIESYYKGSYLHGECVGLGMLLSIYDLLNGVEMGDCINIEFPTMGGEFMWTTRMNKNGWKLQVNDITGLARILDDDDMRKAWGCYPIMKEKFKRLTRSEFLEPGDIVGVSRKMAMKLYEHYAIYIGDGKVIHYSSDTSDFMGNTTVKIAPFGQFLKDDDEYFVLHFDEDCEMPHKIQSSTNLNMNDYNVDTGSWIKKSKDYKLYSPEETIRRAYSRLGEDEYSLLFNNCEHFAVWCKTGVSLSYQVNNAARSIF